MNLSHLFDPALLGLAHRTAIEFEGTSLTFGEVEARGNRMARALAARGFEPGDRLCVQLPNSLGMIDLYLACVKTGVIFVPVNVLYRDREVAHIVGDAEPRLLVTASEAAELGREAGALPADRPLSPLLDGDSPAAILYTSGTTGASKGAVLTHINFAANAVNILTCWRIAEADRLLLALPLFHVHGLGNGLHAWLASGCRMRLLERFEHQRAAAEFLDFRPTLFFGVPTIYVRLLDAPRETARAMGAGMRLFVSGSAPLAAQVLEDFEAHYGHRILERYGMTETLMNIGNPYSGERRAGTVGLPLPGVSARLLDREGQPVPEGQSGELYIKGPTVFPGYWRREEATRESFVDGYFRTGDIAVRAPDGYYTLKGRRSDLIISGGFNIYPREIEEWLIGQKGVREAAVAGVADRVRGEVPVAYLVTDEEFDAASIEADCREAFASFKVPRAFIPVASLPRTALGKVQKHLLPRPTSPSGS
jgi:malonyl-CoA/methylmalonyl-CoA synthetase